MKQLLFLLLPLCLLLASCRAGATEPEQLYLVSAVGFDRTEDGLRVVTEVPLTRENEADKMEVRVFEGTGTTLADAMDDLRSGLGKKLFFGHCAVAVIGDRVSGDTLRAVLDFLTDGEIPLSVTVVSAPDARELLARGSLSAPAAGYEIPDILRLRMREGGISVRCRVYEIAAQGSVFSLPRFLPNDPENAEADRFAGERAFREWKAVDE